MERWRAAAQNTCRPAVEWAARRSRRPRPPSPWGNGGAFVRIPPTKADALNKSTVNAPYRRRIEPETLAGCLNSGEFGDWLVHMAPYSSTCGLRSCSASWRSTGSILRPWSAPIEQFSPRQASGASPLGRVRKYPLTSWILLECDRNNPSSAGIPGAGSINRPTLVTTPGWDFCCD